MAASRNLGARQARGSVLLFTDADAVLEEGVVERVWRRIGLDRDADAIVGVYHPRCGPDDVVSRFKNAWIRSTYLRAPTRIDWLFGCLTGVRRDLLLEYGGFDPAYGRDEGGSDIELGLRMSAAGRTIVLDPSLEVRHLRQFDVRALLANDFRRAAGYSAIGLRTGGVLPMLRRRRFANVGASYLAGGVLVVIATTLLARVAFDPAAAPWLLAAVVGYGALNRRFYAELYRLGGVRLAAAGFPLVVASQVAAMAGIGVALGRRRIGAREREPVASRRPAPRGRSREARASKPAR